MLLGSLILAGGRSRRFGRPKESLPWRGGTLLLHTIETMLDCTFPVLVVARDASQELPPLHTECDVVFDDGPGEGPLHAIATGMRAMGERCDAVFVTACDAPFVTTEVVGWLAERCGDMSAAIPSVDGRLHPLCAIYHRRVLGAIEGMLAKGERRAQAIADLDGVLLLEAAAIDAFDPQRRFLRNVNTDEEYRQALRDDGQA